jgi:hypothetical protein
MNLTIPTYSGEICVIRILLTNSPQSEKWVPLLLPCAGPSLWLHLMNQPPAYGADMWGGIPCFCTGACRFGGYQRRTEDGRYACDGGNWRAIRIMRNSHAPVVIPSAVFRAGSVPRKNLSESVLCRCADCGNLGSAQDTRWMPLHGMLRCESSSINAMGCEGAGRCPRVAGVG